MKTNVTNRFGLFVCSMACGPRDPSSNPARVYPLNLGVTHVI